MEYFNAFSSINIFSHHIKQSVCGSRARYRDGKKDTAVKVYTVNQESVYVLITNVPAIGGSEELRALCDQYGIVDEFRPVDDYPCEEFTEAYLVKYNSFPSARSAKRCLDDKSFLGSTLHVFYAPEFETVYETRMKLQERRKYIAWKTKKGQNALPSQNTSVPHCSRESPVKQNFSDISTQPVTYVWAGKEYTVYPSAPAVKESSIEKEVKEKKSSNTFLPRQLKQKPSSNFASPLSPYEAQRASTSNSQPSTVDESYLNTVSYVRNKVSNVSVPNMRVSLKRRKRV